MATLPTTEIMAVPSFWVALPFCVLLLCIALGPVLAPHFWERRHPWVASGLGALGAAYYVFGRSEWKPLLHAGAEFAGFLGLVGALYTVSGGVLIRVKGEATPMVNVLFLFAGAVVSNLLGTTGASMMLIRPWIRMNKYRYTGFHTVFFIFLVSNCGGLLTPIGDPPLFLGYLKGVPFWWSLQNTWREWVVVIVLLLLIFYVLDRLNFLRAPAELRESVTREDEWVLEGRRNIPLIMAVLAAVFMPVGWRECTMGVIALVSYMVTPERVHQANHFEFSPLREVAWLFAAIFVTMLPVLEILGARAGALGVSSDLSFFLATGILSGVLDNAPTYLAFLCTAMGLRGQSLDSGMGVFIAEHGRTLAAISVAAVFGGALTYIGNGPNLMVKKIADQHGVKTPGFFEYVGVYAVPVLLPILLLLGWVFFGGN